MLRIFLAVLSLVTLSQSPVLGASRVALVVGVSNYKHAGVLANTVNDAKDMSAALTRLGFDVETVIDPDRLTLEAAVRRYGDRSTGAEVSLFHYAGHALEAGGRNWILPASANIKSERDLQFEAIDLNAILEQPDGLARMSIAFLDACRDNPFARQLSSGRRNVVSRGLARVESTMTGALIAFATSPGQIALDGDKRNSPFTAALLNRIATPGLEIKSLMAQVTKDVVKETKGKQRPWQNSSLEGEFFFVPPQQVVTAMVAGGALPAVIPVIPPMSTNIEVIYWESVRTSRNPADFESYLARFPNGTFVDLARNRIASIKERMARLNGPLPDETTIETAVAQPAAATPTVSDVQPSPAGPGARIAAAPPPAAQPSTAKTLSVAGALAELKLPAATIERYEAHATHKAFAYLARSRRFFIWHGARTPELAETKALEACQLQYGEACVLVAIDQSAAASDISTPRHRDMPRLSYAGRYRPENVPLFDGDERLLQSYATMESPRAMAIRPTGARVRVAKGRTLLEAQEKALADCNNDKAGLPCFIYAVDDRVVIKQRSTKPVN